VTGLSYENRRTFTAAASDLLPVNAVARQTRVRTFGHEYIVADRSEYFASEDAETYLMVLIN